MIMSTNCSGSFTMRTISDTRHNLYHKCYKEIRTYEENLEHRPKGIEENEWKKFLDYRQKEETKKKCKQTALNRSKRRARKARW
ncbi:hypothetical protein Ahy_B01g056963 [Arachis hypogaea]|uniref:Uncharacterized protein n=1 Tax=Arachis hypogaea TaxID=3818 RepID=A0A445AZY3_ARAHY|nr:hypothetical protein Ahy_B01g056963 [Arachis hypogaea]